MSESASEVGRARPFPSISEGSDVYFERLVRGAPGIQWSTKTPYFTGQTIYGICGIYGDYPLVEALAGYNLGSYSCNATLIYLYARRRRFISLYTNSMMQ